MKKITKIEALKKLMKDNGGIASWGDIYDNIEKYRPGTTDGENWQEGLRGVLSPDIRAKKNFKRIGFGTFALLEYEYEHEKQPVEIKQDAVRWHSYIQGMMVKIGNHQGFDTYCSDPKKEYLEDTPINRIATIPRAEFPRFTHSEINEIAKEIDVIWFNKEGSKFPRKVIEVGDNTATLVP